MVRSERLFRVFLRVKQPAPIEVVLLGTAQGRSVQQTPERRGAVGQENRLAAGLKVWLLPKSHACDGAGLASRYEYPAMGSRWVVNLGTDPESTTVNEGIRVSGRSHHEGRCGTLSQLYLPVVEQTA